MAKMETVIERTTSEEQRIAKDNLLSFRNLVRSLGKEDLVDIGVKDHGNATLQLPFKLMKVIQEILDLMSQGKSFSLVPANAELTTQEAADMMNVSRPFVVKLLESKAIPYKMVGTHRRIYLEDLLAHIARMRRNREEGLNELSGLGQKYNM